MTYTLVVSEQAISASNKVKDVPAGSTPTNVLLTDGATGGRFTDALVAYVQPASAGKAQIVMGEFAASTPTFTPGTFYLKFTPSVGYSGQAIVGYKLLSSLGTSNTGTVTYNLGIDTNKVVAQIDSLLHGFLRARRGMIASPIDLPNLADRRNLSGETSPFSGSLTPNSDGVLMSFATSIVQVNAAAAAANGIVNVEQSTPFNIWINGTFKLHNNAQSGDRSGSSQCSRWAPTISSTTGACRSLVPSRSNDQSDRSGRGFDRKRLARGPLCIARNRPGRVPGCKPALWRL